jgi:hypothetical protein
MKSAQMHGVTAALQVLAKKGLISRSRANILILDRKGLEKPLAELLWGPRRAR